MALLDEDFADRLAKAPAPNEVVAELFEKAITASEARTFLSILDFEIGVYDGKRYLVCEMSRQWIIQQFADYFSRVLSSIEEFDDPKDADVGRRLQMLAYSQFWECLGIQRMVRQLVGIVAGDQYQERLFLDRKSRPKTCNVFQEIRKKSIEVNLKMSAFLEAVYSNQIRNAFSHSEIWMVGDYISFENCDASKADNVANLKFETWDNLFKTTSEFIIALFEKRRTTEAGLRTKAPYVVDLPEFAGPFSLSKDDQGYWGARPRT